MSLKLIEQIAKDDSDLSEITRQHLDSLVEFSIANGDFRALEKITNSFTGLYDYDLNQRYWLKSDFYSQTWKIELLPKKNIREKIINWGEVILHDNSRLTSKKNTPLLNAFKYWILSCDNPLANGGRLIKGIAVYESINRIINLINCILINAEIINLAKFHLAGLNNDFLMALLVKLASGKLENGIYDYHSKVEIYLRHKINLVSDKEATNFKDKHPFITRKLHGEDQQLSLSLPERIKVSDQ